MWLENETKQKWKYTFLALGVNLIVILIIIWASYIFWDIYFLDSKIINEFKTKNAIFFYDWGQFRRFSMIFILRDVLYEEAYTRGPVWLLVNTKFKNRNLLSSIILIVLTSFWAKAHVLFWPVFIAGMIWGIIVIKTKSLWPSIVCHSTANIFLYLIIKIFQYFHLIT